jgi:hypothetical protein
MDAVVRVGSAFLPRTPRRLGEVSSEPSRRIRGVPTIQRVARTGLTLQSALEPTVSPACQVILTGRATIVPFTTVLIGPERTTTDNVGVASTSTVP